MTYRGSYTTESGKSVAALLNQFAEHAEADLGAILYVEASGIITQAQGLVPVKTGTLQSSGYVAEPVRDGNKVRVDLGFGGPAAKINPISGESSEGYALHVHEDLESFHPSGGIALYLEIPFRDAKRGMGTRIAEGLRKRAFGRFETTMTASLGEVADGPA